ncbi:Necrosis inducing protein NPP1 [Phytophthora megakarya]|uniref:Necrosis inducing protein NPP1 n=1 Tax=Phytophthora megakarya TaxID=4795 RepID=A0A225URK8_9STRA|nr:Necrosis inducing protein NPP1 [Phytophthora megakarya]
MYGRSMWYQDKWAIVYAWYFPKNFWAGEAKKRHNWASMVVWIDNPAVETPKIIGASLSRQTLGPVVVGLVPFGERNDEPFQKMTQLPRMAFVGTRRNVFGWIIPTFSDHDGIYHDLIMWDQLTDAAREALNSADFEEAKVPFNDNNFEATLAAAWPF